MGLVAHICSNTSSDTCIIWRVVDSFVGTLRFIVDAVTGSIATKYYTSLETLLAAKIKCQQWIKIIRNPHSCLQTVGATNGRTLCYIVYCIRSYSTSKSLFISPRKNWSNFNKIALYFFFITWNRHGMIQNEEMNRHTLQPVCAKTSEWTQWKNEQGHVVRFGSACSRCVFFLSFFDSFERS